jgi:hypothetical protein
MRRWLDLVQEGGEVAEPRAAGASLAVGELGEGPGLRDVGYERKVVDYTGGC